MSPNPSTLTPAQFEDAPEGTNGCQGFVNIDLTEDHEALAWSDDDEDSTDDDEGLETYNVNRVEDEDWEIAERGNSAFILT